ncbi:MAG TPA: hypothetical protein VHO69_15895 [Phototrophicaceae bacterium]|nr:hypothetical protein [Phototrophicaceae bacterium]
MEKAKPVINHQQMLMDVIRFNDEDLEANRDGYMTQRQRSRLNDERFSFKLMGVLALVACPIFSIAAIIDGIQRHDTVASRVGIIGLICLVTAGITLYTWLRWRRFDRDLSKGEVAATQGLVRLGMSDRSRSTTYMVTVDYVTLNISKRTFFTFKNGDPYCLYYTPYSRTLLSAEWLRED